MATLDAPKIPTGVKPELSPNPNEVNTKVNKGQTTPVIENQQPKARPTFINGDLVINGDIKAKNLTGDGSDAWVDKMKDKIIYNDENNQIEIGTKLEVDGDIQANSDVKIDYDLNVEGDVSIGIATGEGENTSDVQIHGDIQVHKDIIVDGIANITDTDGNSIIPNSEPNKIPIGNSSFVYQLQTIAQILNAPATGHYKLESVDGVLEWVLVS